MMGALIKAETRKIVTTNLWWGLLIPVVVVGFGTGLLGAAFARLGSTFAGIPSTADQLESTLPVGLLSSASASGFSTVFSMIFGAMAFAGEYRNKMITTTFLTATPRSSVLMAKLVSSSAVGLLYGLASVLATNLGALLGVRGALGHFGSFDDWLAVNAASVLAHVLWALLGVGFGTLMANAVLAVIIPLVYIFVVESILSMVLRLSEIPWVSAYLPESAGTGVVSNLAVPLFVAAVAGPDEPNTPRLAFDMLHFFVGGNYGHPWWASLLTFTGYTAVFIAGGWLLNDRRDIG